MSRYKRQAERIYKAEGVVARSRILSPLATRSSSIRRIGNEIRAILRDPTLGRYYPEAEKISRSIRVTDGRGFKCATAIAQYGEPYRITIPRRHRNHWTICHEVAHVLTDVEGHGSDYAGALWLLVTLFLDPDLAKRFERECKRLGISIDKPKPKRKR